MLSDNEMCHVRRRFPDAAMGPRRCRHPEEAAMHRIAPRHRPRRLTAGYLIPAAALALTAGLTTAAAPAGATTGAGAAVTVNGDTTYQAIAGFGASEGFGEAEVIQNAPAATQQQALHLLYGTSGGAGLTIL